ncbi:unnamed protein product [Hyaloperonospora brassicae]|uniref:Uncharacterized protein n=1 Tax=Hyaloperonospora brassicae TaxID=162125 RepID=A0AAV0UG12_HYABA|nr:unnamed protein product [Hyaloperonospora brassicae]
MGRSSIDRKVIISEEFTSLAKVLVRTADDAATCLETLKKRLSEFDNLHHSHDLHAAKTYMQSDIRKAKYISAALKSVAQQIRQNLDRPSKTDVKAAYSMMNSTAKAMGFLVVTAHNYDLRMEQSERRVKDADKVAAHERDQRNERDEGGNPAEVCSADCLRHSDDTVEVLVRSTLRDNFSLNGLSCQASAAENALLLLSIIDRAKEVVRDMKHKLKGKSSPAYTTDRSVTSMKNI